MSAVNATNSVYMAVILYTCVTKGLGHTIDSTAVRHDLYVMVIKVNVDMYVP
jgi:hypothetical protein